MLPNPATLKLCDFNLYPNCGFLSDQDPLTTLPGSSIFSPLEQLAHNLPKLLVAGILREELKRFSQDVLYSVTQHADAIMHEYTHENDTIMRRMKVIFDYLGQAYVWSQDPPATSIPIGFARFWHYISEKISRPPILSYASYVLDNWHRINTQRPIALGNIAVTQNFLGGLDEDWFILVHVDIEQQASVIPAAIIAIFQALARRDFDVLVTYLSMITLSLERMLETLCRMPEHCDEYIYYTRVRPYLHGWKSNPALPNGIIYEGVTAYHNQPQQFRGESGAQSGIVPSLTAALDIRHTETTFTPYLKEIRNYMPRGHRRFIKTIEDVSHNGYSVLDFVVKRKTSHPLLYDIYRRCRQALYNFRRKHYEYVGRYIHSQAQQHTGNPTTIGTAGTPFMTSLKQLMDETWFD